MNEGTIITPKVDTIEVVAQSNLSTLAISFSICHYLEMHYRNYLHVTTREISGSMLDWTKRCY